MPLNEPFLFHRPKKSELLKIGYLLFLEAIDRPADVVVESIFTLFKIGFCTAREKNGKHFTFNKLDYVQAL